MFKTYRGVKSPIEQYPVGYSLTHKWKAWHDLRNHVLIAGWVPRGPKAPPRPWWHGLPLIGSLLHGTPVPNPVDQLIATVMGRSVLTTETPMGEPFVLSVADNVVTDYGLMWMRNMLRVGYGSYSTNPISRSGSNVASTLQFMERFITDYADSYNTNSTGLLNPFRYGVVSDVSTAESATEDLLPAGTYAPSRLKDSTSLTDLTKLHTDSGLTGANYDVYLKWYYATGEANGTWRSMHLCYDRTPGANIYQGARVLHAAAVTKDSAQQLKVEYTATLAVARA